MMDYDLVQLIETGLDTVAGIGFTGNEEKYISAVQRFFKNHDKNRTKVQEYYAAKDHENYAITVHALKSNAKMIGAEDLSLLFEELENAARNGDTAAIENKTAAALKAYDELAGKLEPVVGQGKLQAPGEISAGEARKTADELLAALDDFDDELAKKLAVKLGSYPFRITQQSKLEEALTQIDDFLYDEAAENIKEIYPHIE